MQNSESQSPIKDVVPGSDIEQITKSTNLISNWSMELLESWGVPDKWITYINMLFLLAILTLLVFVLQYLGSCSNV